MASTESIGRGSRPLDPEDEEVTGVVTCDIEEYIHEPLPLVSPLDVHVFRAPGSRHKAQIEGKAALQNPTTRRNGNQPRQQTIESHPLAFTDDALRHGCNEPRGAAPSPAGNAAASPYFNVTLPPGDVR